VRNPGAGMGAAETDELGSGGQSAARTVVAVGKLSETDNNVAAAAAAWYESAL